MQPVTTDSIVFSGAWFARHQRALLWLLAAPVLGRWFKWVLCIRPHDVGYRGRIVQLLPHAYVVDNGDGTRTGDFRTHEKFGKRLYYAFRPLWWSLHAWDALIANPLVPALNAGFDTLTVYPDPGTGATTCDGVIWRNGVDESFATIRAGAGNGVVTGGAEDQLAYLAASTTSNQFAQMWRGFVGFDTSALTSSAAVSAAGLSLWVTAAQNGLGAGGNAHVAGATPATANTLSTSDFGNVQRTSFGSVSVGGITTGTYTEWSLNATGRAAVSTTGVTNLSLQTEHDLNGTFGGTWSSGTLVQVQAYHADQTGSANDPKFVVTYTVPGILLVKN